MKTKDYTKKTLVFAVILSISISINAQVGGNGEIENSVNSNKNKQTVACSVPIGGIIMWSGTAAPNSKWVLCVGGIVTNPKSPIHGQAIPDLRGRFVIGYDPASATAPTEVTDATQNYGAIHNKGGSPNVTLTRGQLPPHHHEANASGATISITESGEHQHTVKGQRGGDNNDNSNTNALSAGDKGVNENSFYFNHISSKNDKHSHPNKSFRGLVGKGETQGLASEPHENRPPYYVLAYIMRVK